MSEGKNIKKQIKKCYICKYYNNSGNYEYRPLYGPQNDYMRKKWSLLFGISEDQIDDMRICISHFSRNSFVDSRNAKKPRLKIRATPLMSSLQQCSSRTVQVGSNLINKIFLNVLLF